MPEPTDPPPGSPDDDKLGDAGQRALAAERKARREAEQAAAELRRRLDELEGAGRSELERITERATAAEQRAVEAERRAMRSEVALAKKLTPAQARRLVGDTLEALEADADELLSTFGTQAAGDPPPSSTPPPTPRPRPDLGGGSDPTVEPEETDVRKLADRMFAG